MKMSFHMHRECKLLKGMTFHGADAENSCACNQVRIPPVHANTKNIFMKTPQELYAKSLTCLKGKAAANRTPRTNCLRRCLHPQSKH